MIIALVGNANSGKTTLFNALTKTYQKVGNWTGVTVEKKEAPFYKDKGVLIRDLPGTYSLEPFSQDEIATRKSIVDDKPTVIINVVDGTNLIRNLNLTCQLTKLNIPMVIAVNFADELEKNGIKIDYQKISLLFNAKVIPISAKKNTNLDLLISQALETKTPPKIVDYERENGETLSAKIFSYLSKNLVGVMTKKPLKADILTEKIDKVLTSKFVGIPIFALIMFSVYFVTLKVGGEFSGLISSFFEYAKSLTFDNLSAIGCPEILVSFFTNAIIKGVGGVLQFLPQILILFFFLALLEQSGYMARAAFLFDGFLGKIGLSGKSVVPLLTGCGCAIPALLSTRTISNKSERRLTVFLTPFMPCGAKMAVFAWFSSVIFGGNAFIAVSMYFLSVFAVAIFGFILKKFRFFRENRDSVIFEMPVYRVPKLNDVFRVITEKCLEFLAKAGTVLVVVSVVVWGLTSFGSSGYLYSLEIEKSFLAELGNFIKYIFYPLGFGNWQASVSVVSGFFAKEAVMETLQLISANPSAHFDSAYSAYAFMAFTLLSAPCFASIVTAFRELGSFKLTLCMLIFETLAAYFVALVINLSGILIINFGGLIYSVIIVIMCIGLIVLALILKKRRKNTTCKHCFNCNKEKHCGKRKDAVRLNAGSGQ